MKIVKDYSETEPVDVIEITEANYINDYDIKISFNDGTTQVVDFKPFLSKALHPSISKYLDLSLFSEFKVSNGNLNWNDYDMIFPIHDLYEGKIG
jgi:hypothetical protein